MTRRHGPIHLALLKRGNEVRHQWFEPLGHIFKTDERRGANTALVQNLWRRVSSEALPHNMAEISLFLSYIILILPIKCRLVLYVFAQATKDRTLLIIYHLCLFLCYYISAHVQMSNRIPLSLKKWLPLWLGFVFWKDLTSDLMGQNIMYRL